MKLTTACANHLSRKILPGASLFAVILSLSAIVVAQEESPTNPKRGFNPAGSYALSNIETINTTNGNMILRFPLGTLPPGRAGLSAGINLLYNSKLWDTHVEYVPDLSNQICPQNFLGESEAGGWRYGSRFEVELINRNHNVDEPPQCPDPHSFYIWKLQVTFPDGSRHEFRPTGYSDYYQDGFFNIRPDGWLTSCPNGTQPGVTSGMTYFSTDGTYMRLFFPYPGGNGFEANWILSMPDGTRVTNENWAQRIYDRNNNYVELTYVDNYNNTGQPAGLLIDQQGRAVATQYDYASSEDLIHVSGVNNEQLTWRVSWKTVEVNRSYTTTSAGGSGQERGGTSVQQLAYPLRVVDRITLPAQSGGLTYVFGYNADTANPSLGWGEVNAITLPTSAVASYGYFMDGNGPLQTNPRIDRVLDNHPNSKTLTYQQEYDGGSTPVSETWQYSVSHGGSSIISPDGGVSTESFGDTSYPNAANGLSFTSTRPDGTVIERIWQQNLPFGLNNLVQTNPYVKTEFTSIRDAGGNLVKTAIQDYNYDKNGNVTQIREYDWVDYASVPRTNGFPSGIPGNAILKRVTTNSYARPTADASVSFDSGDCYQNPGAPYLRNAIASTDVGDGGQPLARVEFVYDDSGNTGNLTQRTSWDSTKGAYNNPLNGSNSISTSHQYDGYGNPILLTDARGYQTQIVYGDINGFTGLYPTETRTAYQTTVQRTETRQYDFYTGLVTRVTDADNNVSTSTAYDVFGRPTLVRAAEGKPEETRTATTYSDVLRRVIVRSDLNGIGDGLLVAVQHYDQLGRLRLLRQLEDSANQSATDETTGIKSQTRYLFSGSNSYGLTSNPYRAANSGAAGGEAGMGWTRSKSDNAGRVVEMQTFAGAGLPAPWGGNVTSTGAVISSYNANEVTITDQAGKSRKSVNDALGRLLQVYEDPAGLNYATSYGYNALDSLVNVNQDVQTRTFAYDSLKRLSFATNPESGTINYQYDNNGNLTQKNDARGVVTSYAYDALNRTTSRGYSDGTPGVSYAYDSTSIANGRGRLASVGSSVSSYSYTGYDALGRPLGGSQTIGSKSYSVGYTYDRGGHVLTQTYPSGRTVTNTYDTAGRANSVSGNLGDGVGRTYSTGITYSAGGQITQEQFGTATPIYNKLFYNSRSQLVEIRESTAPNDTSWNRGAIINEYGGANNNGNLQTQNTYIPHDDQVSSYSSWPSVYQYDALNRLTIAWEAGNPWPGIQQAYQYDRYGNRTIDQANTVGNVPRTAFAVDTNTNRLMVPNGQGGAMSYDAAGNLTFDSYTGEGVRVYDAENRMTQAWSNNQWQLYSYDGDGRRVKRNVNGTEMWQVYGIGGELLAEYAANTDASNPQKEYGYRNGQILVTAEPSANVHWMATDQLGTPRMIFDSTGSLSGTSRHDYLPFGEELFAGTNWRTPQIGYGGDGTRQKFTQKERDNETGLDYAINRYYSAVQGRFTGTDPLSGEPNRPQSWNRYSYVLNNPLKFIDPDGLRWVQRRLADGLTQYGWCETEECYNTATNTKGKNYAGWTAVTFDETESFTYRIAGGGGDRYDYYQLNPDGAHGCTTCEAMSTDWNAQFAIGGLLRGGMIGLGRGFAALFGRQATTTAGGEVLTGLYGKVTAEALESAAASGGPTVQVFTRLTQAPAVGKTLSVAYDKAGAIAARNTGQLYQAEIPRALIDQLKRSGLAFEKKLVWEGGKKVHTELQIMPQATKFVTQYFK